MKSNACPHRTFRLPATCGILIAFLAIHASLPAAQADMRKAARKAVPAVVAVEWRGDSTQEEAEIPSDSSLVPWKLEKSPSASLTLASGTVVSADGLVVTTNLGEGEVSVTFADGRSLSAKTLVDDRRSGLLLLQVDASELSAVEIAEEPPQLAQTILAAVCTGKTERAVAQGIVTATDTSIPEMRHETLETDAAVGQMSAGSPVVDDAGRLIGLVVAMKSPDPRTRGPALVIPATYVRMLLEARSGDEKAVVQPGYLGVSLTNTEGQGAVVNEVIPKTPAAEAGIVEEDVFKAVDGKGVGSPHEVIVQIGKHRPSKKVLISLVRDGQLQEIEVTLSTLPEPLIPPTPAPRISATRPGRVLILNKDGVLMAVDPNDRNMALGDAFPRRARQSVESQIQKAQLKALTEELQKAYMEYIAAGETQQAVLNNALKEVEDATDLDRKAKLEALADAIRAAHKARSDARKAELKSLEDAVRKASGDVSAATAPVPDHPKSFPPALPKGAPRIATGRVADLFEKRTPPAVPAAIRVERSDTEKAVEDLSTEMKALRDGLEEMREMLSKLNERLDQ